MKNTLLLSLLLSLLLLTPLAAEAQTRRQALSVNVALDGANSHITTLDVASGILDQYEVSTPVVSYGLNYQNGPLDTANGWGYRIAYIYHRFALPRQEGTVRAAQNYGRGTSPVFMLGMYYQWALRRGWSMRLSSMLGLNNLAVFPNIYRRESTTHLPELNRTVTFRSLTSQIQPFSQVHLELSRQLNLRWELGGYVHVSGLFLRNAQYELRIDHQTDSRPEAPVVRREWVRTSMESAGAGLSLSYRMGVR